MLPDRIDTDEPDIDDCPKHQLVAEKTDEVWQQAKLFVTDAFALKRGRNWQIHENGFKKQQHFMVRTTSIERDYRFFNFAFVCVLYNVWRLVDLLVKHALDGENRIYKPLVDANQFLSVAKQWYGLDPPD